MRGFSDGDFSDDGSKFQHVGPETAIAREPYVTNANANAHRPTLRLDLTVTSGVTRG